MVGGNLFANGINYLYHVVMGRIMGPADYGVLASIFSILYLISVVPTSASIAVVKFVSAAKSPKEVCLIHNSIEKFVLKLSLILSLAFLILSPFISKFLNIQQYWSVFLVAPVVFLSLMTVVNQSTSQGLLRFFGNAGPNIISAAVKIAAGLVLVILGWSVFGAMIGVVLGALLAFLYSLFYLRRLIPASNGGKYDLTKIGKYSLPVVVQAFAFTSLFSTDVLLVKHFLSPVEAGLYGALSTLGKIIFFATSPVAATMFPIVSRRNSRNEGYRKIFFLSAGIILSVSLSITIFYWLFPNIAIGVLYGSQYLSVAKELVWMGAFLVFYSLSSLLVNYSLSLNNSRVVLFPLLAAVVQVILINLFHGSILQVIQISLTVMTLTFLGIAVFLGYNHLFDDDHGKK